VNLITLQARIELWKSIDPDPAFCRKAEREMLMLRSGDNALIAARMQDFDLALAAEQSDGHPRCGTNGR
jgi:hypothetical protein